VKSRGYAGINEDKYITPQRKTIINDTIIIHTHTCKSRGERKREEK
jgi:hypothetical protein